MLRLIIFALCTFAWLANSLAQTELPMSQTDQRFVELPMSATTQKNYQGQWAYFEKGSEQPFTGILYATYPNGQFLSRQEYVNGIGNGTWINYYENGELKEVGTYVDNRVEGPIKKYYPNGQLKAVGNYRDWRIRVGVWQYYDENGAFLYNIDHGKKGDFSEVEEYYQRGDISRAWYEQITKS